MITMFLLVLQGWQRKVSTILTSMFRKQEIVVLLYVIPLLVIMSLTSGPHIEENSIVEVVVKDSDQSIIIVAGTKNISQPEYFNRPSKTWELDLISGKNNSVPLKSILLYNGIFYYPDFAFGKGRQPFIDAKCKVDTCMVTDDSYLFDSMGKSLHKSLNFSHNVTKELFKQIIHYDKSISEGQQQTDLLGSYKTTPVQKNRSHKYQTKFHNNKLV